MTKEEYKKAASVINEQILKLKGDLHALRKAYVESNSTIPAGTKVKVYSNAGNERGVGILLGYEFMDDYVHPIVAKMKKDGTAHKSARILGWRDDTIKPIEWINHTFNENKSNYEKEQKREGCLHS